MVWEGLLPLWTGSSVQTGPTTVCGHLHRPGACEGTDDTVTHLPPRAASQPRWGQQARPSPGKEVAKGLEASRSLWTKGSKDSDDRRTGNGVGWGAQSPPPRLGRKSHRKTDTGGRAMGGGGGQDSGKEPQALPLCRPTCWSSPCPPPPMQVPPFCPWPPASSSGPSTQGTLRKRL